MLKNLRENPRFLRNLLIVLVVAAALTWAAFNHRNFWHRNLWAYLIQMRAAFQSIETARAYIESFGVWGPAISALLMVFQSVIAPLPAFVITFANGAIFGFWRGTLLSWSSAMLGAAIAFYISRIVGPNRVARIIGRRAAEKADWFFEKYGTYAILIARLVPVISFDAVSYAAGLTRIRFIGFWIATGIGQLPATLVYSYLGEKASAHVKLMMWGIALVVTISTVVWLVKTRKSQTK